MEIEYFSQVIQIILNNWTALELAIEHNYHGPTALLLQKLSMVVDQVQMMLNAGSTENLSDALEEFLEADFHTVIEDESADEVADHLFHLFRLWSEGKTAEVRQSLEGCRNKEMILTHYEVTMKAPRRREETDDEDEAMSEDEDNEDGGGWTVVKRK